MKRTIDWLLTTAVVLSISMSVTSCKDDDDDSGSNGEVGGASSVEMLLSDDETVLASLVQQWCDVEPQDLKSGILNQTFEPTIGVADGNVRSMVMETQEAADAYAASALSQLNINPQSPAGFSWSGGLGSVGYDHGSGNELGVISVNIRQIPHLQKIRLLKDAEDNVQNGGVPYYHKGDIVKYTGSGALNGKYFICLNEHNAGQPSNWINFDTDLEDASTGTCNWMLTGQDTVYNTQMASTNSLAVWLEEFVLNEVQWRQVITRTENIPGHVWEALVPSDDRARRELIRNLIRTPEQVVLDAWQPIPDGDGGIQAVKAGWPKKTKKTKSSYVVEVYEPTGLLLCNSMRWSLGTTYDYWVPHLSLLKRGINGPSDKLWARVLKTPSQTTLSKKHFEALTVNGFHVDIQGLDAQENGDYDLFQTAVHWTHDPFKITGDAKDHYGLLNFTAFYREEEYQPMTRRNLTSHELTVNDNGAKYKYFEDVYRRQAQNEQVTKEPFTVGDVLKDNADGSRWFCIRTSCEQLNLNHAMFISFDGIKTFDDNDLSASNIVNQDEAYQVGAFLLTTYENHWETTVPLQVNLLNNIKTHTSVDLTKLLAERDSIVRVTRDNQTHSYNFSLAYCDGTSYAQPVMRVVYDGTGILKDDRSQTGKTAYFHLRYYNHYQLWDGQKSWTGDWTMSNQRMYLGDVADQQLLNQYATDKWVVLPYKGQNDRHVKRTTTDPNAGKVSRYLLKNGQFSDRTALNMYNEPVLFVRAIWIPDRSLSADGHTFTVVEHQAHSLYTIYDGQWYTRYTGVAPNYTTVDNVKQVPYVLSK